MLSECLRSSGIRVVAGGVVAGFHCIMFYGFRYTVEPRYYATRYYAKIQKARIFSFFIFV